MIIRKGKRKDIQQVYDLVLELAIYENGLDEVKTSVQQMEEDGFGQDPVFEFFVAENKKGIVGLSLYYYRYSTWKGKLLYVEDLIVTERHRRSGLGTRLMEATIKEAQQQNCKGIHWQVLEWNEPALAFYKKYNPVLDGEWINCRIDIDQLNGL
jgi:GNAT superfamily N-acetyltransferase